MIPFNVPLITGKEKGYLLKALENGRFCGDGFFGKECEKWMEKQTAVKRVLVTGSCTQALEMSAILADIKAGDEVIMPSYTFVSTANAFVLRGARVVFVDIRPDTMNIDETKIENAITSKTKAVVPVHYAGVGCEMDTIMQIARRHKLWVVEDAAQGVMSSYKKKALGGIGHIGCFSFHETKNYHCGEGGAILCGEERFMERAEIIREKGTNRKKFIRGQVDKYTWVDVGSSYLMSELNAAFLYANLEMAQDVVNKRLELWQRYYRNLKELSDKGWVDLPVIPETCQHNAHTFYIKLKDKETRQRLINYLKSREIQAVFHYIPLHKSQAGNRFGEFRGEDKYTTRESERLLRLPLYYSLTLKDVDLVCKQITEFMNG